ncbi:unnamed protein product [Acanthoscelides obtectus]|uniref:Uncharacterized protein n=1 Tax=Acanthoscelides obtectus TaxID=200917 RepID=A0A9P0KDR5_ACAOB|nr:unnamed protein product [Acanthoscelides obtectus]CAK1673433.1 hypothetical protein AOBTE_LOCUS29337 [Acanthoscelides obtectus]
MRSPPTKTDKSPKKVVTKYSAPRKKKMADLKPPVRDTVSETISFVIKGKLTPIKPILLENKLNLLGRVNKRNNKEGKVVKRPRTVTKQAAAVPANRKQKQDLAKNKVQTKTAKKPSAQTTSDKKSKILVGVIPESPRKPSKRTAKPDKPVKIVRKAPISKPRKIKNESDTELPKTVKKPTIKKMKNIAKIERLDVENVQKDTKIESTEENKDKHFLQEVKLKPVVKRKKPINVKPIKKKSVESKIAIKPKKVVQKQKQDLKTEKSSVKVAPPLVVVKTEAPSPPPEGTVDPIVPQEPAKIKTEIEDKEEPVVKKRAYKKLKIQPKIQIVKKRVKSKDPDTDGQRCKTKLFGFWNGPKRHRVASLNALAKVQCLYDNEGKGNLLDLMEEQSRLEYIAKVESLKLAQKMAVTKKEPSKSSRESTPEPPTRTLRSVPGLRAVGKHWEHSDSSSSSDESDVPIMQIKQEKVDAKEGGQEEEKQSGAGQKKKRGKNELVMDLKDMVVRKRMASLNATAILAASYSTEKRQTSKTKNDDSSSDESGSSEEYFAANKSQVKEEVPEDDEKKEEDRKMIEVRASPNKKVAVILNHQDTADVTITGVYVNSTTRSTRHEGYCSIAGMQYRISATSHTQTAAAAAVATAETLLRSGEAQQQQENVPVDSPTASCSGTSSKSYTPLDALSSMQPPSAPPGIHHHHHHQHVMTTGPPPPPQHVLHATHQLSPGLRHGCSSAFSSPHSTPGYHPPIQGEAGYVHDKTCAIDC